WERAQILFAPTRDQQIGLQQQRIGRRYLRRLLRYRPRPYPGPLTLLACEQSNARDPARGWRDLAVGGLDIHSLPGDHFTHLREHAQATAARIDACLQKAQVRRKAA